MSLRDFHVVFIVAAVLCAMGFGWWGMAQYLQGYQFAYFLTAAASWVMAAGLVIYEIFFIKHIKG